MKPNCLSIGLALVLTAAHASGQTGDIARQRQELDRSVWLEERRAQEHGAFFVALWDRLRATAEARSVLAALPFDELLIGSVPADRTEHDWGVVVTRYGGQKRSLDRGQWQALLRQWEEESGLVLEQSEWNHERFIPGADGPARSLIDTELHVRSRAGDRRLIISGELSVTWSERQNADGHYVPTTIDASNLTLTERRGQPAFVETAVLEGGTVLSPLVAADMDTDGVDDLLSFGGNTLYRNRGGRFEPEPLLAYPPRGPMEVALLADFTGDDELDLVVAGPEQFVGLFDGRRGFETPGMAITTRTLRNPKVMSAGDIDADGDLDLWLAQYRPPYNQGQMPTPYYDANDGYIAYLLRNDGDGHFVDVTARAGLEHKRQRRTYSGSLADLDGDGDLDLLVVSDFAGIDLYHNDGTGIFADVTSQVVTDSSFFGMSHAFGDYNADGRLDLYVIGMDSHAARRLDYLGLGREEYPEHDRQRAAMTFGNRMYLGSGDGLFTVSPSTDQVARTGWSWGVASADFDNDGDDDIYVANGHRSGGTARDYDDTYWIHDIYAGDSDPDPHLSAFFDGVFQDWDRTGISWNGFQHNRLYLSEAGRSFVEIGYLMGVASESDGRSVLDMDVDDDGRVDLLFSEWSRAPFRERVHVLRNTWPGDNNWVGVHLRGREGVSPVASRVVVRTSLGARTKWVYIGESLDVQRSTSRRFGLGKLNEIEAIEVHWPDGRVTTVEAPQINRYHVMTP